MKVPKGLQEVLKLEPYFVVSKGVQMSEYNITEVKFAQNHTSGEEKELSLEIVFVRRYVDLWTSLSMYSRSYFSCFNWFVSTGMTSTSSLYSSQPSA